MDHYPPTDSRIEKRTPPSQESTSASFGTPKPTLPTIWQALDRPLLLWDLRGVPWALNVDPHLRPVLEHRTKPDPEVLQWFSGSTTSRKCELSPFQSPKISRLSAVVTDWFVMMPPNPLTHPRDAEMRKPQAIENNVLEWFVSMLFSRVHLCRLNFCPERDMSRRLWLPWSISTCRNFGASKYETSLAIWSNM